ncbi:MAG: ribosome maturation factor RimP [Angelakisella sp.]
MSSAKKSTVEMAIELAAPLIDELGLILWDVTFAKEGSVWVLCYLLDKEGGIAIDDCEQFSRKVDILLDAADPIEQSYTLEVSSPGIERELARDWHFDAYMGQAVTARLIRPVEGVRDYVGTLTGYQDGVLTLAVEDKGVVTLKRADIAHVRLYYEF